MMNINSAPVSAPEFKSFGKLARLSKECVITEKIDGTNAQIYITDSGDFFTGSRTRWINPGSDNFGFAAWANAHKEELLKLGPGRHFGEWWGSGIQRNYGLTFRKFSLFNAIRWCNYGSTPQRITSGDPRIEKYQEEVPECCQVVPILYRGEFHTSECESALAALKRFGSFAASGWMNPEGIVVYHVAGNVSFKKTFDDNHKGENC